MPKTAKSETAAKSKKSKGKLPKNSKKRVFYESSTNPDVEKPPTKLTQNGRLRLAFKKMKFYQGQDLVKVPWHPAKKMFRTQLNRCLERYNPAEVVSLTKMLDSKAEKKDAARERKRSARKQLQNEPNGDADKSNDEDAEDKQRPFSLSVSKEAAEFIQIHFSALVNRLLAEAKKNTISRGAKTTSDKDLLRAYATIRGNRRLL